MRFPLGTKLLVGLVLLFLLVLGFLNLSAIFLITEDKRTDTFQAQQVESLLASRSFDELARQAFDGLRLYIASFDPYQPIGPAQQAALQSVAGNQTLVFELSVEKVNWTESTHQNLVTTPIPKRLKELGIKPEDYSVTDEQWQVALPTLRKNGMAYTNLSTLGS